MPIFANRNELSIRLWIMSEEKRKPVFGRFIIGRCQEVIAEGQFLSCDREDLKRNVHAAREGIKFPSPEEIEAQRIAQEKEWKAEREKMAASLPKKNSIAKKKKKEVATVADGDIQSAEKAILEEAAKENILTPPIPVNPV